MLKTRDRFYIGVSIFMVVVVAVFFILYLLGQQKRNNAVSELQSRVAEIKTRSHSQHNKDAVSSNKNKASVADEENNDQDSDDESDIAAHKQFNDKIYTLETSAEWKQFMESLVRIEDGEDTAEDHRRIAALLDANRELFEELRRIAGTSGGFSGDSLQKFIPNVRLLTTNMMSSARRGDYETFFLDLEAVIAFSNIARKDTTLISQLVSNGIYSMLYKCIEENVDIEHPSSGQINQLIATAASATDRERIVDALLLEDAEYMELFDSCRKMDNINPTRLFYATIGRSLLDRDEGFCADTLNQASTVMRLPFYESKPILEGLQRIEGPSFLHPVSLIIVPGLTDHAERQAFHEAQMGLMQVGLAVEQYHAQHGEYPQTLDVIAPSLGGNLPLDPYTGQPFVYKPGDTDFTLYSARGSMVSREEYQHPYTDSNGNIVWRYRGE